MYNERVNYELKNTSEIKNLVLQLLWYLLLSNIALQKAIKL